jgi:putative glutamine amidotransferase
MRSATDTSPRPQGEPPQQEMALGLRYLRAIEAAGGIPVVVPPMDESALGPLLDQVAGVCLSGGPDLDPVAYGQPPHELLGPTWPELDAFELALTRAADDRGLPILAICRGAQVVNVARGGTLHQHVPDAAGSAIVHRQTNAGTEVTHWVELRADTQIERILGCRRTRVNSFHHQAAAELGDRLLVAGRASDGTIESLEADDREFVVGVQWHAECLTSRPRHAALFDAFVAAASRFAPSVLTAPVL